jgi:hypothetical protein
MGHERQGALPHTRRWQEIVRQIAESHGISDQTIANIAAGTLQNVQDRFLQLHKDGGVQAAFAYLVSLGTASLPPSTGLASPSTGIEANLSAGIVARNLCSWVREHSESPEYAEIACRAGADTIAEWTRAQSKQGRLFDDRVDAAEVWAKSSSGAGFCQVARVFFARFTERYLRYFLEREASAQLPSLSARESFGETLRNHVDAISHHAFETSKITQSFAAGWFNKHAREARPSDREIAGFLAVGFGKLHEELQREAAK